MDTYCDTVFYFVLCRILKKEDHNWHCDLCFNLVQINLVQ